MFRTRFFWQWLSGIVGVGPVVSVFWNADKSVSYAGCQRLDGQISVYQRWRALSLQVGEKLELFDGSVLERVS